MATISTLSNLAVAPVAACAQRIDYVAVLAAIREVFSGKEDAELPAIMKEAGLSTVSRAGKALKGAALVPSLRVQLDKLDEEGIERVAKALKMPLSYLPEEQEVEAEGTVDLPVLESEPATGNPEKANEEALAEEARVKAERDAVLAEEKARREAEKAKREEEAKVKAETFPKVFTASWGKVVLNSATSGSLQMTEMKNPVGINGEVDFEKSILEMDSKQALAFVAKTREKVAMSGRESALRSMVKSIKDQTKSGSVRQQRLPAMFDQEFAVITGLLFSAINTGDRQVAEGAVYKLLCVAATEFGGVALIDSATIKRIAQEWGVNVPSKKATNMPEQKKGEQKPVRNSPAPVSVKPEAKPAPVVENKPASEPVSEPVKGQESEMTQQQTQSAPVVAPVTETVQAPAEVTQPAVEAPVAPASEEVTQEAPANEPEAPKAEAVVEAPVEQKKLTSMADCWAALLSMKPYQRGVTFEQFEHEVEKQLPNKKLLPHLQNLSRKLKTLLVKGSGFDAAKKAMKNANKDLVLWIMDEYKVHTKAINEALVFAVEMGLGAQEPVGNSPDAAHTDEPVSTPASEESDMKNGRINMHNANANQTDTVLEGTVEGEPTKEAPKVEPTKEQKAAKAKADKEAKKAAAKAKKDSTPKLMSTVKVGLIMADNSVRRFCAPLVPAQKETLKALLNELTTACGESDALVNPNGKGLPIEVLRSTMLQAMEASVKARENFWAPVKAYEAAATTDDQNRQGVAMRKDAVANWGLNQSNLVAKEIEEALNAYFTGPEGLAKKQATMMACQYFLGRNETVQKEGRFVTELGAKAIAEKAKELKAKLDAMKSDTAEEKAEKARLTKGLSLFASVKDDKSYRALRVKLANAKVALARAVTAKLEDAPMMAKLEAQVAGIQKVGEVVDNILRGTFAVKGWDISVTGTTAARDMEILVKAILDVKFASTVKDEEGKDVVRMDGIAGSSEELRDTVGKLAAGLLVKVLYENTQLDLEVREIMEEIKSPKLLVQAAAKPGFRGYARTTAWAIYAGGVYVVVKTAAVLNWAAAPLKAAVYGMQALGLYGIGFFAENKEENAKAVSEALANAKEVIIGFFVAPKDLVVNGWNAVKNYFTGEKKADATVADASKTETPKQGEKEGVMNTISEKSKSVVTYIKDHKLETAGVVAGGVAAGVGSAMLLGTGVVATAGAVIAGAAVIAGGIWAFKKIAGWFSGRKAEKAASVKTPVVADTVDASAASASL